MAYLKVYYPLEYFTTLLSSSENSIDKVISYIEQAKQLGIKILPPSINDSAYSFSIKNSAIIFGFNSIKGIGNETINKILTIRNAQEDHLFKD